MLLGFIFKVESVDTDNAAQMDEAAAAEEAGASYSAGYSALQFAKLSVSGAQSQAGVSTEDARLSLARTLGVMPGAGSFVTAALSASGNKGAETLTQYISGSGIRLA